MSDTLQSSSGVAIARQLAASHASASLPCPVCASTLKAANLERHLGKVHPEHAQSSASPSGPLQVQGIDRGLVIPAVVVMILWGIGAFGLILQAGGKLDPVSAAIFGATAVVAGGFAAAVFTGKFKATLELEGSSLRVRWMLGLATKRVSLPAKIETGALMREQASTINQDNVVLNVSDHRVGTYLRIGSITIASEEAAGLGRHWAQKGWSKGKKIKRRDIDVDRAGMIAIEYQLAGRGQLTPKV